MKIDPRSHTQTTATGELELKYEITEIPVEEILRIFLAARSPNLPADVIRQAAEVATAVMNLVLWCEVNEAAVRYEDMLALISRNTGITRPQLFTATVAATRAANVAIEEELAA